MYMHRINQNIYIFRIDILLYTVCQSIDRKLKLHFTIYYLNFVVNIKRMREITLGIIIIVIMMVTFIIYIYIYVYGP